MWIEEDKAQNFNDYMAKFGEDLDIKIDKKYKSFHIKKVESSKLDLWCDYTMNSKAGVLKLTEKI